MKIKYRLYEILCLPVVYWVNYIVPNALISKNTFSLWLVKHFMHKKREKSRYKRSCKYLYMKIENIKERCAPNVCNNLWYKIPKRMAWNTETVLGWQQDEEHSPHTATSSERLLSKHRAQTHFLLGILVTQRRILDVQCIA